MNHRTQPVVRDMVQGDKHRAANLFRQPLNGVEFLLQRQTCISQDLEAWEKENIIKMNVICNSM